MIWLIIAIIATLAAFVLLGINYDEETWSLRPRQILCVFCMLLCLFGMIKSIPTGYTGILTTFGRVEDNTLDAGLCIIKPTQKIVLMDNREQRMEFKVSAFSSDIQQTEVVGSVNYMIDKSAAMNLYREVGTNYKNILIAPRVLEDVKAVFSHYTAEDLIGSRDELSDLICESLHTSLSEYGIIVTSVAIEDIDFTDTFTNAVEAKQVAAQEKLTAETKQEQATMEQKAAAERQMIAAEADAAVKQTEADAEAYAIRVRAEAEAEANMQIAATITDELIEYTKAQMWDGELPTYMGNGTPVLDLTDVE